MVYKYLYANTVNTMYTQVLYLKIQSIQLKKFHVYHGENSHGLKRFVVVLSFLIHPSIPFTNGTYLSKIIYLPLWRKNLPQISQPYGFTPLQVNKKEIVGAEDI